VVTVPTSVAYSPHKNQIVRTILERKGLPACTDKPTDKIMTRSRLTDSNRPADHKFPKPERISLTSRRETPNSRISKLVDSRGLSNSRAGVWTGFTNPRFFNRRVFTSTNSRFFPKNPSVTSNSNSPAMMPLSHCSTSRIRLIYWLIHEQQRVSTRTINSPFWKTDQQLEFEDESSLSRPADVQTPKLGSRTPQLTKRPPLKLPNSKVHVFSQNSRFFQNLSVPNARNSPADKNHHSGTDRLTT